jgi:hypothetical protein
MILLSAELADIALKEDLFLNIVQTASPAQAVKYIIVPCVMLKL